MTLSNRIDDQQNLLALDPDWFRGGYWGTGGNGGGKSGTNGDALPIVVSSMTDILRSPLPFAHPEQCTMLLERADIYFCVNSPPMRSRAHALYQRLLERLDFLQFLPSRRLENQYQYHERRKVMPKNSLERLKVIRETANARLRSLKSETTVGIGQCCTFINMLTRSHQDFHGHPARWVPRASYTEYEHVLDNALADFKLFEDAYIQCQSARKEQETLMDKVKLVSSQTSRMVALLDADKSRLLRELQDLDGKIVAKKFVVQDAQRELEKAYDAEKSKIRGAFGLSIPKV